MMALLKYYKALKDGLPEPRGLLVNKIPSHAIEQANQEVNLLRRESVYLTYRKHGFEKKLCDAYTVDAFS